MCCWHVAYISKFNQIVVCSPILLAAMAASNSREFWHKNCSRRAGSEIVATCIALNCISLGVAKFYICFVRHVFTRPVVAAPYVVVSGEKVGTSRQLCDGHVVSARRGRTRHDLSGRHAPFYCAKCVGSNPTWDNIYFVFYKLL